MAGDEDDEDEKDKLYEDKASAKNGSYNNNKFWNFLNPKKKELKEGYDQEEIEKDERNEDEEEEEEDEQDKKQDSMFKEFISQLFIDL